MNNWEESPGAASMLAATPVLVSDDVVRRRRSWRPLESIESVDDVLRVEYPAQQNMIRHPKAKEVSAGGQGVGHEPYAG